jgi:hypothetical protein
MPLPLVVLGIGARLAVWVQRTLAAGGLVALGAGASDLWGEIKAAVVAEVAERSGLGLDPVDPFSDASIANAVSVRIGVPLRSVVDQGMIREDVDAYLAGLVSQKSGYTISSVTNIAALRSDLERVGAAIITERTGIPLGSVGAFDPVGVREQILAWAKAELMANVGGEAGLAVEEIINAGGIEAVASDLNSRLSNIGSIESVTARQLAVKAVEKLASDAVVSFGRDWGSMDKATRKRLLNRSAQAKFRAAHGNRQQYVPLGWTGTYTPPVP